VRPLLAAVVVAVSTSALLAPPAARGADAAGAPPGTTALAADASTVELSRTRQAVAPGVSLERLTTLDAAGPVRTEVLRIAAGSTSRPELLQDSLSHPRTPADLAAARGAVAAVNGDFFDIDRTGAPDGPVAADGTALKAEDVPQAVVGLDGAAVGRLSDAVLAGTVTVAGRTWPLASLNPGHARADAVAVYTPAWGPGDRRYAAPGDAVELEVRDGRVSAVRPPSAVPVPAGGLVVLATGTAATALAATAVGAAAAAAWQVRGDALPTSATGLALGARLVLLREGRIPAIDTSDPLWGAPHPRTAIGWTAAGDVLLLTVDGSTARSRGLTAPETAQRLLDLGADDAVMLDGGGSAQLVARAPGDAAPGVVGVPSDGAARPVANAVGVLAAPGDGRPHALVLRSSSVRLFPGLRRAVTAVATDSSGAPVPLPVTTWATSSPAAGVETTPWGALLHGATPGRTRLTASAAGATGALDAEVLGPLTGVEVADGRPVLAGPGASADVTLVGHDAEGRRAPVDAGDVVLGTDPALLRAEALPDGRVRLTALAAGPVESPLDVRVGAVDARLGVAVGLGETPLDPLSDATRWRATATRATASLTAVPAPDLPGATGALRLTYDSRDQPAGTSTASVVPASPVVVPSGAREVALQVRGDGRGGWLRGVLRVDGADRPVTFADQVDWTGWRRLVVPVPAGARKVALTRVYLAQTDVAQRTAGTLDLALLQARTAAPAAAGTADPDPADGPAQAPASGRTAAVAVLSGTHVQAASGAGVGELRRAVQDAVAAGADRLLLTGDVVGAPGTAGTAADVDLARSTVQAAAGATAWTWLPGDGEVGTSAGAPAHQRLDLAGTRYLLLDSAGGTLRGADAAQLPWLRAELDAAAGDPAVTGVVVVADRGPGSGAGDLTDPDESTLLSTWTSAWRAGSGKRIAVVSGGDGAAAGVRREEGVLDVTVPDALAPAAAPGAWTLLTLAADRATRPGAALLDLPGRDDGWLRAEVRPLATGLVLAPVAVAVGGRTALTGTVTTPAGRTAPLAGPAAPAGGVPGVVTGGPGLLVAPAQPDGRRTVRRGAVAVVDPRTLQVQGLAPGTTTVTVRVGAATATATVRVG